LFESIVLDGILVRIGRIPQFLGQWGAHVGFAEFVAYHQNLGCCIVRLDGSESREGSGSAADNQVRHMLGKVLRTGRTCA